MMAGQSKLPGWLEILRNQTPELLTWTFISLPIQAHVSVTKMVSTILMGLFGWTQ
jgi:hypothetical protein